MRANFKISHLKIGGKRLKDMKAGNEEVIVEREEIVGDITVEVL
jgi:hypothetical protein